MLLVQAWEAAVEGPLEGGLFALDEENASPGTSTTST